MEVLMGETANTAQAAQVLNQRNAFIRAAYLKVSAKVKWATNISRDTVDTGIAANTLNQPAGCAPGSVIEMSYYDPNGVSSSGTGGYIPIEKRYAPTSADQDQEQAVGGATFTAVQGAPQYWWEEGGQLRLYPYTDKSYKIRRMWNKLCIFTDDTTPSLVDGQLVAYYAGWLACVRKDPDLAGMFKELFTDRLSDLRKDQNTGQSIPIDASAQMGENQRDWYDQRPMWSQAPTVR